MNAPRLSLVKRLRIAQAAPAVSTSTPRIREAARKVLADLPQPDPEAVARARAIERAPLHTCGIHMVICADCRAWICRAPGHALHVCPGPEFSQVVDGGAP